MIRRIVTLALVPIALAGCGGASESEQVSIVARHYFTALANGNGAELCSLVTGDAKAQLVEGVEKILSESGRPASNLTCPEIVKYLHGSLGQDQIAAFKKLTVTSASVAGTSATVRVASNGRTSVITLSKTAAGWLISKVLESASS